MIIFNRYSSKSQTLVFNFNHGIDFLRRTLLDYLLIENFFLRDNT